MITHEIFDKISKVVPTVFWSICKLCIDANGVFYYANVGDKNFFADLDGNVWSINIIPNCGGKRLVRSKWNGRIIGCTCGKCVPPEE